MRAPASILQSGRVPKAWIAIGAQDLLRRDGLDYAKLLANNGVEVETKEYEGAPHQMMIMDGMTEVGRKVNEDTTEVIRKAFSASRTCSR